MNSVRTYAVGVLLLGLVGLAFGDFALQWQPVPATMPYRVPLAYLSALLLIAAGACMLVPRLSVAAALSTGCLFALWTLVLKVPRVLAAPVDTIAWLGVAEILALAAGGITAWALRRGDAWGMSLTPVAQRVFGACAAIFGLSHFVYADFTAGMVPAWIPAHLFWAYATGTFHLTAALSLLSGVRAALSSTLLTLMLAGFVTLLHLPRVIAQPRSHAEWVMLAVATSLTGAAWIIQTAVSRHAVCCLATAPAAPHTRYS